jgi:hypothetical protein
MKKFSTATPASLTAPSFARRLLAPLACTALAAFTFANNALAAGQCSFRADAPNEHKVVKGDTLWDISGQFLEHPWCWPQVWGLNREQIRDPHWIYPGQVVVFDRAAGRLRLSGNAPAAGAMPEVRMGPQTRVEVLGPQAIATIPAAAIEPFLTQPLIVETSAIQNTPRVMALEEGHMNAGLGDKLYVLGDLKGETQFQAFRPAQPIKDPATGEVLGYEAAYLATARLERAATAPNEAHRFIVASSKEEVATGARLVPVPARTLLNYAPHAPASAVDGRVVSIYGGLTQGGRNNVVVINRGSQNGIEPGVVLALTRQGRQLRDPQAAKDAPLVRLPDERYGTLFVFRVFDKLSYGLVMQVTDAVRTNDLVRSPE